MRTDLYTKAVLTVIALMLAVVAGKTVISVVGASSGQTISTAASAPPAGAVPVSTPSPDKASKDTHRTGAAAPSPAADQSPKQPSANGNGRRGAAAKPIGHGDCISFRADGTGCATLLSPRQATQVIKDGFADMSHAFGMAPGEGVPPPKVVSVADQMKINLGEAVTIGRSGVLFTPLLHSDGLVQDLAAGSKNISLTHRLSGFEYPKAEPLNIGARVLPVLDSENHIVKPASGTVLVSVNGQFGAMYERDFNNPNSAPQ